MAIYPLSRSNCRDWFSITDLQRGCPSFCFCSAAQLADDAGKLSYSIFSYSAPRASVVFPGSLLTVPCVIFD
jgi:hypothetical protein